MRTSPSPVDLRVMPLLNVRFGAVTFVAGSSVVLREVTDTERSRWRHDSDFTQLATVEEIAACTHVIEQRRPVGGANSPDVVRSDEDQFALMALIELLMPERLRAPVVERTLVGLADPPVVYENPSSLRRWERVHPFYCFALGELPLYWALVTAETAGSRRLRRALSRTTMAREQFFAEDRVLFSIIALECLFSSRKKRGSPPASITNMVVASAVIWMSDPDEPVDQAALEREFQDVKKGYRLRSKIVHGDEIKPDDIEDVPALVFETARRCVMIALKAGVDDLDGESLYERFRKAVSPEFRREHLGGSNAA